MDGKGRESSLVHDGRIDKAFTPAAISALNGGGRTFDLGNLCTSRMGLVTGAAEAHTSRCDAGDAGASSRSDGEAGVRRRR